MKRDKIAIVEALRIALEDMPEPLAAHGAQQILPLTA
jgi:hypothetical protein